MAKTRRKRKTKHRGNAAGMVESRGRTGRRPTAAERKGSGNGRTGNEARTERANRFDSPPTWRSAAVRAALAAAAFFGFLVLLFKRPALPALAISVVMVGVYTPLGYYTDLFIHRRRIQKKLNKERRDG